MLKKLRFLFDRKQRLRFAGLFILIFIGALLEFLGVSLIFPLVKLLTTPDKLQNSGWFQTLCRLTPGWTLYARELALIGLIALVYVLKNLYGLFLAVLQRSFIVKNRVSASARLLDCFLHKPYTFHLQHNSSELIRNVNSDITAVFGLVFNWISLFTDVLLAVMIVIFLFTVDATVTAVIVAGLAVCSVVYFLLLRRKIRGLGQESRKIGIRMLKATRQSLGGIKEIKVSGTEKFFTDTYTAEGAALLKNERKNVLYSGMLRRLIEVVTVCSVLSLVAAALAKPDADSAALLASLTAFGVAAIKLLPAATTINNSINGIIFSKPSLDAVYDAMAGYAPARPERSAPAETERGEIALRDVSFTYPGSDTPVLKHINVSAASGACVGISGVTGAGKTTLVDILLGLLPPDEGAVTFCGRDIREDCDSWQSRIGYIPQFIYLTDDSIRRNVALGTPDGEIDDAMLWKALDDAQLGDFVRSLKDGENTVVGERGVRLSGGQRQRIGIARALYRNPGILFFDEATSSLDEETERAVMSSVRQHLGERTCFIVSHRKAALQDCDVLWNVRDNQIQQTQK